MTTPRLMVLASHPIQYQAPLFRALAERCDLTVFFAHRATPQEQADAGFGVRFDWDLDLLSGYQHEFLINRAKVPGTGHFGGCDTPDFESRLASLAPAALLVTGWHLKSYVQAVRAARRRGIPVMVRGDSQLRMQRSLPLRAGKAIVYPLLLRAFDAALYVGERSQAYWEHYHYPQQRLFFSPHCVDIDWFAQRATVEVRHEMRERLGIADHTALVLFAGKLAPRKRPIDVIDAAARLRRLGREVEVMVAGAGELQPAVQAAATAAGIRLHDLGFCNQSQMPAVYVTSDILVLPSAIETWGLVVNEALACGRPAVVSDACGCAPDLVADGAAGRMYATGDIDRLAAAIDHVLTAPPSASALAARSAAYSPNAAADGIMRAVEAVGGSSRSRSRMEQG